MAILNGSETIHHRLHGLDGVLVDEVCAATPPPLCGEVNGDPRPTGSTSTTSPIKPRIKLPSRCTATAATAAAAIQLSRWRCWAPLTRRPATSTGRAGSLACLGPACPNWPRGRPNMKTQISLITPSLQRLQGQGHDDAVLQVCPCFFFPPTLFYPSEASQMASKLFCNHSLAPRRAPFERPSPCPRASLLPFASSSSSSRGVCHQGQEGLRRQQREALVSIRQRHQTGAPCPPPPPFYEARHFEFCRRNFGAASPVLAE